MNSRLNPNEPLAPRHPLPRNGQVDRDTYLLEHLDRAGIVLENCRRMMAPGCQMVITVPNAFSVRSLLHVLRGYEKVAPDHVSYYSYSNVGELAERNGFTLDRVNWYRYSPTRKAIDRVVDMGLAPVLWMWPQLSEGLIAECSLATGA